MNGIFILIDIWITAMPIRALQFYIPTGYGLLYILFTIAYAYAGGTNTEGNPYVYSVSSCQELSG